MIDYQKCFIENMKLYRHRSGISQARLAEMCDVSNGTIGNIECGMTKPSFDLILQIARSLGIKPATLFFSPDDSETTRQIPPAFTKDQIRRIKDSFAKAVDIAMGDLQEAKNKKHTTPENML